MRQTPLQRNGQSRQRPATCIPTVCVVDPHAADYQSWRDTAAGGGLSLQVVASAEDALRLGRTHAVDLWVVNTQLPGLSGGELCNMLKARSASAVVYLVADEYSVEAERLAWASRATLFGVKPEHHSWLALWQSNREQRSAHGSADRAALCTH